VSKKAIETLSRTPAKRDASKAQRPSSLYLRVVYAEGLAHDDPFIGRVVPIGDGYPDDIVIGRAPDEDTPHLLIEFDAWASRSHTRVAHFRVGDQQGLVISDLHSRNGTWVDGVRIGQRTPVSAGQVVRVGSTLLVVGQAPLGNDGKPIGPRVGAPPQFRMATPRMVELWDRLCALAASDVGVLVLGEMGTGKTHLARLLHDGSARRSGPFVPHNCSAIPVNLEEATLFGVVAGFIPTVKQKEGLLAAARGGTLFLDELADMPPLAQAKLLDAFDPSVMSYLPVGASKRVSTDCRLVCATNRDVFELAKTGVLRQDLLSRLVVGQVTVPPLRERREDLLAIFTDALGSARALIADKPCLPNVELADAVLNAHWTENVRGLKGLATRFALGEALTPEDVVTHADRGFAGTARDPQELASKVVLTTARRSNDAPAPPAAPSPKVSARIWPPRPEELLEALASVDWNVKSCAELYDRRRETVARLMRQLFGEGGKLTAQRAYRVWRESDRVPAPAQLHTVFDLFFERPDGPETEAARQLWRRSGVAPEALEPKDSP